MSEEVERTAEPTLPEDPKLSELFEFIKTDEGVRVLPVTVKQTENDTRLFIAIQGDHETASTIMAQLMAQVGMLHDVAEQQAAEKADGEETRIVTS